jgi:hypothetical protein
MAPKNQPTASENEILRSLTGPEPQRGAEQSAAPEPVNINVPQCTECLRPVIYPNFNAENHAGKHRLPAKTYYHPGGRHIADLRDRRRFSPTLILRPAREYFDAKQQMAIAESQLAAKFSDGKYTTTDAEEQYYLDRHPEPKTGDAGLEMWRSIYLTADQQTNVKKAELADLDRQINERKGLLETVQAGAKG